MSDPLLSRRPLRLRLYLDDKRWMGPGKADLLALIAATGSISAAGRRMGMSYKRAWTLVEALNAMFREPLVESARGGAQGGGAALTPLGQEVLARFRAIQDAAERAGAGDIAALAAADMSERK
ncbi:LysR family transcriptional regulator [Paracoccus sp. Z118]|uniref:winged helix-turn-helix domain-containing protein n=1 Tax=Paracoccus sp. Z118 TaxID=2851017 RepID=UPI001C2B93E1|nr:LysR family transcriptional regulator [Paracoccus sp. Z118]MBV0892318.1 LysR family transcriptional regulator [Paracoccus sp. Z118]